MKLQNAIKILKKYSGNIKIDECGASFRFTHFVKSAQGFMARAFIIGAKTS